MAPVDLKSLLSELNQAHRISISSVVLLDLNEAQIAKVAQELEAYKVPVGTLRCDVTISDDVTKAA
ncbi:hypothetical protein NIES2101_42345 [Calothrix sp. HK-06]|nr:hypothetical protein NIES2101_42345 [Calothrix sp. HK-06]